MIGINYVADPRSALKGCHNDAENIRAYLLSIGYPAANIRLLRDKSGDEQPTRANLIAGCKWLMEGARAGDTLFMHYSGHGTQSSVTSTNSTKDDFEADGKDEGVCVCSHSFCVCMCLCVCMRVCFCARVCIRVFFFSFLADSIVRARLALICACVHACACVFFFFFYYHF